MTPEEAYKILNIDEWNFAVGSFEEDSDLLRELEKHGSRCAAVGFTEAYNYLSLGIIESETHDFVVYALIADDVSKEEPLIDLLRDIAKSGPENREKLKKVLNQVLSEFPV